MAQISSRASSIISNRKAQYFTDNKIPPEAMLFTEAEIVRALAGARPQHAVSQFFMDDTLQPFCYRYKGQVYNIKSGMQVHVLDHAILEEIFSGPVTRNMKEKLIQAINITRSEKIYDLLKAMVNESYCVNQEMVGLLLANDNLRASNNELKATYEDLEQRNHSLDKKYHYQRGFWGTMQEENTRLELENKNLKDEIARLKAINNTGN